MHTRKLNFNKPYFASKQFFDYDDLSFIIITSTPALVSGEWWSTGYLTAVCPPYSLFIDSYNWERDEAMEAQHFRLNN